MAEATRFADKDLQLLFRPKFKHFKPTNNGHDQFGNRLFSARREGLYAPTYIDREGKKYKAALLISSEGEKLIKENGGILNDIDQGILAINHSEWEVYPSKKHPERSLHKIWTEAHTHLARLRIEKNEYLLKWLDQEKLAEQLYAYQPFINEMLQMQDLQKRFGEQLLQKDINVILPTYFFASGFLVCKSYEPGEPPSATPEIVKRIDKAMETVMQYVWKQREIKGSLWENVHFDTADWFTGRMIRTNNFILRPDNKLAWIDVFAYFK